MPTTGHPSDEGPVGHPGLAWLLERARWRLARGWPLRGEVTYTGASPAQRAAVADLLGTPEAAGPHLTVDLAEVDGALRRRGIAGGLAEAAAPQAAAASGAETGAPGAAPAPPGAAEAGEGAGGPAATRARRLRAWAGRRPALAMWAETVAASGLLDGADAAATDRLLDRACALLDRLPADGIGLADLCATVGAEPGEAGHDAPVGRLVLPAAALLGSVPPGGGPRWAREVWAAVGVVPERADDPVAALGVTIDGDGGRQRFTLRELVVAPRAWNVRNRLVSVCQHEPLLARAADRGPAAPLVSLGGRPNAAVLTLLRLLARAGARFRVHADFDWAGVTAANAVIRRVGGSPWRLDAATYRACARAASEPLRGSPVAAAWDSELAPAMREAGVRVPEADRLDTLARDLDR